MGTIEEPLNDSKGCGGVMRMATVGLVADTQHQAFTDKVRDLFGREINHGNDLAVQQVFFPVMRGNLSRGLEDADSGPKINRQPVGRLPGFGKIVHGCNGSHPHVNFFKIIPVDGHVAILM